MLHDGDDGRCSSRPGSIMAPSLAGSDGTLTWSWCSRESLRKFLESDQSQCLKEEQDNEESIRFPKHLPGERYDQDVQCQWQFGPDSRGCWFTLAKVSMVYRVVYIFE